ncbi:hypothetical protein GOBAR_AA38748 [Gossypium barbadense]|uniref:Uncharacterized protein n=1 Tax=Gossypium barbadense TaxID=3634 RepID=A0A2P5VT02_GOSBA|nr:hypothetical protein GOBAR_AA38748 [Gossypium barbadense]
MKRGHTTNAWHENYKGKNPTGTWSSQDRAYKLNLRPPVSRCHQRDLKAKGVPNMTEENGQAKLEPIAMHKPPQEIFDRYRELGHGVVGYISMGTGLTGRKIITPATTAGDRLTPVEAFDCLKWGHSSLARTSQAPRCRWVPEAPAHPSTKLPMVSEAPAPPSHRGSRTSEPPRCRWCPRLPHDQGPRLLMVSEAPAYPRHQGADAARGSCTTDALGCLVVRPRLQHVQAAMCGCSGTIDVLGYQWCLMLRNNQGPKVPEALVPKGEGPG